MKKLLSLLLVLATLLLFCVPVFAEATPQLEALDTSAINGKHYAYTGVENYVVIYPMPEEAEDRFDVRSAVITVGDERIVSVRPEKVVEYRFGSVLITGKRLGQTTVAVTDPESGVSCSFTVVVLPGFLLRVQNFFDSLQYVPFFIGMALLRLFGYQPSL